MNDIDTVLPFNRRDFLPKNSLDQGLFVLMVCCIPTITAWELFILFQSHPVLDFVCFAHLFTIGFICVNMIGNLYYLQRVDSSGKQKNLPAVLHLNWKYCHFCEMNSPPRSYHCPVCDECILKRDQHCMTAGCCVGFYNHRYYFMALFYMTLGSLFAWILQASSCFESVGGPHLLSLVSMAAPHMAFLFGFLSFFGFLCAISQSILTMLFVLTSYLLLVQIKCISSGQTIHEKRAGITLYDLGWKNNFVQVLGAKWYLALFNPFASSPIQGDGINFQTFYDLSEIKNV